MGAPQYEQAGADIGGTGTTNTIPRWTGPSTLGDSGFVDDGSTIAAASRMLAIGTSSTTGARVWIQNNSSGNTLVLVSPSGAGSAFGQLIEAGTNASDYALNIRQRGTANSLVYVRGDGNVGIGTASPLAQFTLGGAANATYKMGFQSAAGPTEVASISMNSATGEQRITSGFAAWGGFQTFYTNGFERARIDSAGNFGIGTGAATTTPAATGSLVIGQNNVSQQWAVRVYGGNDANRAPVLSLFRAGNAESIVSQLRDGALNVLGFGTGGGIANFNDATLASYCQVKISPSSMDISGSSYGLKLPATPGNADTQTLDCYEENTWTPTRAGFGGTNPTVTASYTRVGRLVTITVRIVATGGAQYSGTSPTTTLSMPATITPAANTTASSIMVYGDTTTVGTVTAWNDGLIYLPTFALTTQQTAFSITYRV